MGSAEGPAGREPVFWKELYWFAVICAAGLALLLLAVVPRAARYRRLLELEARLTERQETLEREERRLQAAIRSVERDPLYREALYRRILGATRPGEEVLEPPPGAPASPAAAGPLAPTAQRGS